MAVSQGFELYISVSKTKEILSSFNGVSILDNTENAEYPTPRNVSGKDDVYVGRIRKDHSQPNTIECWVVADNLRKGAALNAVQIAEEVVNQCVAVG